MIIMKTKNQAIIFGENLKRIRKEKGLTQYDLADLMNTSQRMITHYENQSKRPPLDKIKDFAKVLNVHIEQLINEENLSDEATKKDKASYSIMKRVKIIEKLPLRDQKAIFRLINSLAEKNKLKQKKKPKKE